MAKSKAKKTNPRRSSRAAPSPDKRFEIEHAADTLIRAEGIRADSKLMPEVKRELAKRSKAIAKANKKA